MISSEYPYLQPALPCTRHTGGLKGVIRRGYGLYQLTVISYEAHPLFKAVEMKMHWSV